MARAAAACIVAAALGALVGGVILIAVQGPADPELLFPDWSTEAIRGAATELGIHPAWLVRYVLVFEVLLAGVGVVAAVILLRGGRMSGFRMYLAAALAMHTCLGGVIGPAIARLYPALEGPAALALGLAWCALLPAAYAFPDGHFVPRWTRLLVAVWAAFLGALLVLPPSITEEPLVGLLAVALFGSCAAAQVSRYRRVSGLVERAQQRWVALAMTLRFAYEIAIIATPLATLLHEHSARGLATKLISIPISYAISAALAAAVTVAIVRHRLYDVDLWITRTVVYTALTAFVIGTYALVVGGIGALVGDVGGAVLPLAATAVVALAIDQVRVRVQRRVRRMVYGARGEPNAVVSELGRRLGEALPPDSVATTIVTTVSDALKLPYVEIVVPGATTAWSGTRPGSGPSTAFELRYDGERLGELRVSGEPLSRADRDLLTDLTRQAGVALHAARATADLRRSRSALATSREEERRRLHRDLHDGLGPTLAGLYQRIDAAHRLVVVDPDRARNLLDDSRTQMLKTIDEVRELVDALRPAVLDEIGLTGAVALAIERLAPSPGPPAVALHADADLPVMATGVEVAAYRIAVEAITNVVRHAEAGNVTVSLTAAADTLVVRVVDDGQGIAPDSRRRSGLRTIRERAEEIGGTVQFQGVQPHGTAVIAELPLDPSRSPA